jgi:cytochrome c oxidase subunit 3
VANAHASPVLKHHFEDLGQQHACERLGMWMFLVTEILFFGGLFAAYTIYRMLYPHEFELASSHMDRTIATVNTVFLITSSLTMTLAIRSAKLGDRAGLIRNLLLTLALGTAFMVMKGFEYAHEFHEGLVPGKLFDAKFKNEAVEQGLDPGKVQLFLCFYFVMTGIHGIHIIVGLGCILWLVYEAATGGIPPENYSTVEVVSLYWHLVDAIWLFLMPLLYLAGAGMHH